MIQKATFVKASETGGKAEVELWNAKGVSWEWLPLYILCRAMVH